MARIKPKNHTVSDMYKAWADLQVQGNKDYCLKHDYCYARKGIKVLYCNRAKEVIMTYSLFRLVLETYNKLAGDAIIAGELVRLDTKIGFLEARRIERNYTIPKINAVATFQIRKTNPKHPAVYFVDEDYCRVSWKKAYGLRGVLLKAYEFVPSRYGASLKVRFSKALEANPVLKYNYKFCPTAGKENAA